ncbi:MAG: hypothetical protein ABSD96_11550 [Candidatus Korobacteraceae bacterium]
MRNSLPPKLLVALLVVVLAASLSAQYTGQAKASRMRAVGILRIDEKGKARLYPVTVFIDGKYYDARFYEANPIPFAINGDIFYQAEKEGVPEGNFVIQTAMHTPSTWWAEGIWKPATGGGAQAVRPSAARSGVGSNSNANEDRPVLRRAPSSSSSPAASDAPPSREGKTAAAPSTDAAQRTEGQDPDRPTLRHGKSEQVQADLPGRAGAGAVISAAAPSRSANDKVLLAIADVGNIESRPYGSKSSAEEHQGDLQALKSMATEAIRKAAKERASLRGVDAAKLDDVDMHLLDPDYSNHPVEIFTATVTGAQSKVWLPPGSIIKSPPKVIVALVARKDSAGRLNQIYSMIADPSMLDVRPALQYLGAVDADGSGRAQLLFRKQVDVNSFAYVLYRATPYDLIKTFETKAAEE